MDRSWILHYQNRFSVEYIAGVNSFIDFAKANSDGAALINCPCNDCCNHRKHDYVTVRNHLHIQGMMVSYLRWIYHGEPIVQPDDSDESENESEENQDEYDELIEDHPRGTYLEEDTQERDDVHDFENLLKAAEQSQASVTSPMIEEHIAVDVLGKRSGYLNGDGRNQDEYDELIEDHPMGTYLEEDTQERDDAHDFENLLKAAEQSQASVTSPMIEEHIAVDVLGKRSGYLNGDGIYTRTFSSSTQSRAPHPEVIALREQLVKQATKQAELDRRTRALEAIVQQLAAVAGIDLTSYLDITRGTTSAGDGTTTGDHNATL